MIENKISELFSAIENSSEYKSYLEIGSILEKDKEIKTLIADIKKLQQKSVNLEYNNDDTYKEVDKEIEKKVRTLNSKPMYQEYLRVMGEFNDVLAASSNNIEKYINSKV